jgi:hypothetical protein
MRNNHVLPKTMAGLGPLALWAFAITSDQTTSFASILARLRSQAAKWPALADHAPVGEPDAGES